MSGWFSNAKNALSRPEPETPQRFQLDCECGQAHSGLRRQRHQRLVCKSCGRALFILPRDVYPQPQVVIPKAKKESLPADDLVEPGPISIARLRKRTKGNQAERGPAVAVPDPKRAAGKSSTSKKNSPASDGQVNVITSLKEGMNYFLSRRFWTPFRSVAVAVICIGLFTTFWMVRQSQISHAVATVRENGEKGMAYVQAKDWGDARRELEMVERALDRLGRTDPESLKLRQYSRELRAMGNLCPRSLDGVLDDLRREYDQLPPKAGRDVILGKQFRGQWLILEGTVADVSSPHGRTTAYELTIPVISPAEQPDEKPVTLTIQVQAPIFEKLIPKEEERPLIFSGEILGGQYDAALNRWTLLLNPDTVFLWTHLETYLAAGFELNIARTEQAVVAQLKDQAQAIGEVP